MLYIRGVSVRKFIVALIKSFIVLYILNIFTNNSFGYNILNIFILMMLGFPGVIVIYLLTFL
ncbi:pro-sigmaK processing inhibitor BofA family protein [Thomasclavelia sp.]